MPKIKSSPFEIGSIDHSKQRMRLNNMMESLPNLSETNFPGLGKTVKLPKTMGFNTGGSGLPLIREGMFNDLASGTFSPTAANGQQFTMNDEEMKAMSSTTVKKGSLIRKKVIASSKTTRGGVDEN
jgi:hypothetical protein